MGENFYYRQPPENKKQDNTAANLQGIDKPSAILKGGHPHSFSHRVLFRFQPKEIASGTASA
jgi:hypothetical protein